jgi:hypothetical protein
MIEPSADRAGMTKFVRNLFLNILEMPNPPAAWIDPWIERALQLNNHLQIFDEFITVEANVERLSRIEDTRTNWPSGHFYSPVVSRKEALSHWDRLMEPRQPTCIHLDIGQQLAFFESICRYFKTIPFPENKSDGIRYYYNNPSFAFQDALIYWSILNHFKPRRIIEVGSGFSSALAVDTIELIDLPTIADFIDPYSAAAEAATAPLPQRHNIVASRIQDIDPSIVTKLESGDILFIDSSHVVKTGSDVHFEITELLPRLKSGVLIHFHEIFYPFEYVAPWVLENNHSWNEAYFLHAFLMFNNSFQIVLFNDFVVSQIPEKLCQLAPEQIERFRQSRPGSLWLRRV